MRIILKIIAAPAVLVLTLIVAVLNFSVSLASWVLGILSLVLAVCGLFDQRFPRVLGAWHPVPCPCGVRPVRAVHSEQSTMGDHRAGACFSAFPFRAARRSRMAGLQAG